MQNNILKTYNQNNWKHASTKNSCHSRIIWIYLNAWESQHESTICKQNSDNTPGLYKRQIDKPGLIKQQTVKNIKQPENPWILYKITNLHIGHIVDPQLFTLGILYKMTRLQLPKIWESALLLRFYFLQYPSPVIS